MLAQRIGEYADFRRVIAAAPIRVHRPCWALGIELKIRTLPLERLVHYAN
jgi:hypothetical protein